MLCALAVMAGLGQKFAMIIFEYSRGNLLLALVFTMFFAIVLGMGMPTTAAYAISASALALIKPGWITDLIGLALLAFIAGWQWLTNQTKSQTSAR
ncbi:MAG: hypothetical protein AB1724_01580 [Thermodesulfobacteriota bacterium]